MSEYFYEYLLFRRRWVAFQADYAKNTKEKSDENSFAQVRKDPTKLSEWSHKCEMEFNVAKCLVTTFRKSGRRPDWECKLRKNSVQVSQKEKNLEDAINDRLSPEDHIIEKVRNIDDLLANKRVTSCKKIIPSFIRPTIGNEAVIWNPHLEITY